MNDILMKDDEKVCEEDGIRVCEYCDGELVSIMLNDESYLRCIECSQYNY